MAPSNAPKCAYVKMVNKVVPAATEPETTDASTTQTITSSPSTATSSTAASSEPPKTQLVAQKCQDKALRIVGDCTFCGKGFCSAHRMLFAHECPGMEAWAAEERERNRQKLDSGKTKALQLAAM